MTANRKAAIRDVAVIIAAWLLLTLPPLFMRDLWNPDEPRYMEVAREMVVLKVYAIPHLNGEPYPDKPPAFFWAAALLWKLGLGLNAGRILAGMCSLVTVLMIYAFCRRHLGSAAAVLAAGALLSTVLFAAEGTAGVIDPVLTCLVCGIILAGYAAMRADTKRRGLWWLVAYVLAGAAVLTKGPVGLVVPWIVLALYGMANRKNVAGGPAWAHLGGQLLCAAIVLTWLVRACKDGGPQYTFDLLISQSAGRVVASYSHRNPFYYYLVRVPVYLFPWSLFLPLAVWSAVRGSKEDRRNAMLLAVIWVTVYLAFFSCISGKRMGYVLPMAPAVAMMTGHYLTAGVDAHPRWRTAHRWLFGTALVVLMLLALGLLAATLFAVPVAARLHAHERIMSVLRQAVTLRRTIAVLAAVLPALIAATAGLWLLLAKRRRPASLLAATAVLLFFAVQVSVAPVLNHFKSGRAFCEEAAPFLRRAKVVHLYPQDFSGMYNLYTGRVRMPVITTPEELRAALQDPLSMVIADKRRVDEALPLAEVHGRILMERTVGHRPIAVLGARGTASPEGRTHGL